VHDVDVLRSGSPSIICTPQQIWRQWQLLFGASGNCYLAPVATAVCQWQLLCGIIWRQWQLLCGMISVTQSDQVPNAPYPQSAPLP